MRREESFPCGLRSGRSQLFSKWFARICGVCVVTAQTGKDQFDMQKMTIAAAGLTVVSLLATAVLTLAAPQEKATPSFLKEIPQGYRDWRLISVAHEEGSLHDIRAILGDDVAIKAYREQRATFPDGAIIARIAWNHIPSKENNKVFGDEQSFVPGLPTNIQFTVKDSKKYAATGGWGFGQFDTEGKPAGEAVLKTCYPCHEHIKDRDFVFTRYAP